MNAERDREFFTLTTKSEGTMVMQAHCEIDEEPKK